jgi:methionyl-tRNA formyltransferase
MNTKSKSVVLFCNNLVGFQTLTWLENAGYDISMVVTHCQKSSYYYKKIVKFCDDKSLSRFEYKPESSELLVNALKAISPDVGLSSYFGYILKPQHLSLFPQGIVNVHGGYLPWCRGKNPNAWAIVENVQAGATLHIIDQEVDRGLLLCQEGFEISPDMTAKDVYVRIEQLAFELIVKKFPKYLSGQLKPVQFCDEIGSHHTAKELNFLKTIKLDEPTTTREILKKLRAATFPPFLGPVFEEDGIKYQINISIDRVLE